jgi:UDP:flavonoid glycosyltransferase YjiC (YdhE family)
VFNAHVGFFRSCVEAFGGRDELLVLALGKKVSLDQLGPLPDNVIARPSSSTSARRLP